MQGVVDGAHWVALAVVLASMLRSAAAWRTLLGLCAGAGAAMACIVIARHHGIHVPFFSALPEPYLPRMSGPFGNPLYLAGYMLFNGALAVGFAVRACLPAAAPAAAASAAPAPRGRRRRHPRAPVRQLPRPRPRWIGVAAWACAAAVLLWGLALAGSVGAFAGLFAAAAFAALGYAVLARGRGRWIARAALVALAVSAVAIGMRVFTPDRTAALRFDHPVADYVASVHLQRPGVQSRLAAWEAGLEGLAARPGPGLGTRELHRRLRPLRVGLRRGRGAARPGPRQARRGRRDHRRPGPGGLPRPVGVGVRGPVARGPGHGGARAGAGGVRRQRRCSASWRRASSCSTPRWARSRRCCCSASS